MPIQQKTILVTGAAGYMGRHVVRALLDKGHRVVAADIMTQGLDPRAQALQYDIFSGEADLFDRLGRPDVCVHLAWRDGFVHNSDAHILNLPLHYTFIRNLIDEGLKHFAIMGTMHEVGYHVGAIDENTPCNPISMYGIAKDALRRVVMLMLKDKPVTLQWLRAYYIYGDDDRNHSIFTKLLEADRRGDATFPFTSGTNRYDFIHVDELATQITACVSQNAVDGIINCCTGQPRSLGEIVEAFIAEHDLKIRLAYNVFPDRAYDSPEIWGDNCKIAAILASQ